MSGALAWQATYEGYYLLQNRGPDITPPYSDTHHRRGTDGWTDRQAGRQTGGWLEEMRGYRLSHKSHLTNKTDRKNKV